MVSVKLPNVLKPAMLEGKKMAKQTPTDTRSMMVLRA
jgi:hypothetical protein